MDDVRKSMPLFKGASREKKAAKGTRLIDREHGTRTRPMKVLVLGLSRTGTMSIYTALQQLGHRPYHLAEAMKDPPRWLSLWEEALVAKFSGMGKPFGHEDFDKILGDYDGVADMPCIQFSDELIAAYPEAKVVLTMREVDNWLTSMSKTAMVVVAWPSWKYIAPWDPAVAKPWYDTAQKMMGTFAGRPDYPADRMNSAEFKALLRQAFIDHYEHVKEITPEGQLLEFHAKDGWKPLCEFLGDDMPDTEYPHINETKDFVLFHKIMWWMAVGKMFAKTVLPVGVAVGLSWYFWRARA